ncbi:MAG TPA: alpha/beta hydrolase [Nocardioides sp.]|uniref:alpha/beta hydrolase n=1 Tax=Nocardioides sp. TaxID=35761 RepID=UPI002B8D465A|nr:alpha/beta hydrolase [Nocardioides sp.]HQR27119.1 alpha/beta hydrolase [Nocardioides sp.]
MGYLRRRLVTAALTANALRPLPGFRAGLFAFVPGWLAGELAPHLLAATAVDTGVALARRRATWPGLALAAGTVAGLGYLIDQSRRVETVVSTVLTEGLGSGYYERLDPAPPPDLPTAWQTLVNPFRPDEAGVRVDRDLRYSDAGARGLLDVYRPAGVELADAPVLLQIHGGGWILGRKDEQGVPLMRHMARRGWVVVAINYRLAPRDYFPAQIIDVKRAIAWIKEHIAEYGGDPGYLAITGGSAGGQLTALAALTPGDPAYQPGFEDADTSVQVAVPHYGVYDLAASTGLHSAEQLRDDYFARRVAGVGWAEDPALFEAASPILRITPDAPDFFVIHGLRDTMVPVEQARLFVERLRAVSRRTVVYAELPGAQHAFDIFPSIRSVQVVRAIDHYLTWHHATRADRAGARA